MFVETKIIELFLFFVPSSIRVSFGQLLPDRQQPYREIHPFPGSGQKNYLNCGNNDAAENAATSN
jgi:hypothetical protein